METDNSPTTRFLTKVEKAPSGCWEWIASKSPNGYGQFRYPTGNDNHIGAHVASYRYFYGDVPEGMQIRHTCDNRSCVNPTHLIPGTSQDNSNDMVERGRWNGGTPKKEFCKNNHRIADDPYESNGKRQCRPCVLADSKRRYAKKRQLNKESNNEQ